jgi:hypothetical protein
MRPGFRRDDKQSHTFRLERRELLDEQALRRAACDDSSPPLQPCSSGFNEQGAWSNKSNVRAAHCRQHCPVDHDRSMTSRIPIA